MYVFIVLDFIRPLLAVILIVIVVYSVSACCLDIPMNTAESMVNT